MLRLLSFALTLLVGIHAYGGVLFTESWDNGSIDPVRWTLLNSGVDNPSIEVQSIGAGDYALRLKGYADPVTDPSAQSPNALWQSFGGNFLYSNSTFPRGNGLRCSFKAWHPSGQDSSGHIMGPWHRANDNEAYNTVEAIIALNPGQFFLCDARHGTFDPRVWTGSPETGILMDNVNAAWAAADSKTNAIVFRVYLDDAQGAVVEFSTDGGSTFIPADNSDTRGITGRDETVSNSLNNYLGFGPNHGSGVYGAFIDDIAVEDNAAGPATMTPTPQPPTPTPTATPPPLLFEDWESGSISSSKWIAVNSDPGKAVLEVVEEPAGSGNRALKMGSSDWGGWEVSVWSQEAFPRGQNIRCSFDVWHDSADNKPSLLGWYGPWKSEIGTEAHQHHEACVDHVWSSLLWAENGMNMTGPVLDLSNLWAGAYGRENALRMRVTLGNSTGAILEYSLDGGLSWTTAQASSDGGSTWFDVDTLYRPPFITWNKIDPGDNSPNYISFGGSGYHDANLHTYVDNIKVERDDPVTYDIGYIRPDIPHIDLPEYTGQRYTDLVPDTLDLAERARLALHALTQPLYPEGDYQLYWLVQFFANPSRMWFGEYTNISPKFFEALPLMRQICGSNYNDEVDRSWFDMVLKSIGPEGLLYIATEGKPFILWNPPAPQIITPIALGRFTGGMTNFYALTKDPYTLKLIENLVDATLDIAIDKGDSCFFPYGTFAPSNLPFSPSTPVVTGMPASELGGRVIQGPAQFYAATGYEPALTLSRKCAIYMRDHAEYFNPDGSFIADPDREAQYHFGGPHFACHSKVLDGMTDYALAADDEAFVDFIASSYEWARDHPYSSALVGYFPEYLSPTSYHEETCELADMLAIAVKMSVAGKRDYWDDADRWVRNHFAENQLQSCDWIHNVAKMYPETPLGPSETSKRGGTLDHVPERNLGGFASYAKPNDWAQYIGIMHCCTPNAARTLYHVWKNILSFKEGTLKVNLLLNRASEWADVYSCIPYEGRVDIKPKQDTNRLMVRMPEWISDGSLSVVCKVNGNSRSFTWSGRYIDIGQVSANDVTRVTFPINERTESMSLATGTYSLTIRGTTVVDISPQGTYSPLYQRAHYRSGSTSWHEVERFVHEPVSSLPTNFMMFY